MTESAASPLPPAPADLAPRARSVDSLMIVRGTHAHVPYLRRLKEVVMTSRYRPSQDEGEFEAWREVYCTDAYFTQVIDDPHSMLLCVGTLREPIGMAVLRRTDAHLEVDDLIVLEPGRGDGTRLLVAALRYAEAWRSADVHIDVYPGHEGVEAFLRGHGFSKVAASANDLGYPMHRFERDILRPHSM